MHAHPAVTTEAWPSVACTRWMGAPRSRLWLAWVARGHTFVASLHQLTTPLSLTFVRDLISQAKNGHDLRAAPRAAPAEALPKACDGARSGCRGRSCKPCRPCVARPFCGCRWAAPASGAALGRTAREGGGADLLS